MHSRSNNLSNEDDPYSLEKYPLKYQIVIGKQAYNARQLVKAAQAKGAYLNMYRQPLTSAQIERLKVLVPHELARRNAVARRIDFGSTTSLTTNLTHEPDALWTLDHLNWSLGDPLSDATYLTGLPLQEVNWNARIPGMSAGDTVAWGDRDWSGRMTATIRLTTVRGFLQAVAHAYLDAVRAADGRDALGRPMWMYQFKGRLQRTPRRGRHFEHQRLEYLEWTFSLIIDNEMLTEWGHDNPHHRAREHGAR